MRKKKRDLQLPNVSEIETELARVKYQGKYRRTLRSTIYTLITVAAVAVLISTLWIPVLEIYGNSMAPTLDAGDIVVSLKEEKFERGDLVAFYYNNKVLVKRVIASGGDMVNMDEDGTVYVNDVKQEEPYLTEKAYGDCNIEFPYEVPDTRLFVMGDHRAQSIDSRNVAVGCISTEQIVGKIRLRIWPLDSIEIFSLNRI